MSFSVVIAAKQVGHVQQSVLSPDGKILTDPFHLILQFSLTDVTIKLIKSDTYGTFIPITTKLHCYILCLCANLSFTSVGVRTYCNGTRLEVHMSVLLVT